MPESKLTKLALAILNILILVGLGVVISLNAYQFSKELKSICQMKKIAPYSFSGNKFLGLEETFENVEIIGFYTDKDLEEEKHAQQFAQAQLILAPAMLDLNNLNHEYLLFDCTSYEVALKKIKEIGATALKKNQFGIVLAKRR